MKLLSLPGYFIYLSIYLRLHSAKADTGSNLVKAVELQSSFLQFYPKTLWLNHNAAFTLPLSETYPQHPIIVGSFGKDIRKRHTHFTAFIMLINVVRIEETEEFVANNGNMRKDRYIFVGEEDVLRILFKMDKIKRLKDKIGFIPSNGHYLSDPFIYSDGEMDSVLSLPGIQRPQMGRNLRGRHLRISGCLLPTWLYRTADEDGPNGIEYDGSNYRLFLESSNKFNYTFELHAPPTQGYGALLPNGTWTGMASDLYYTERNFDIAVLLGHVIGWFHFVEFASTLDFAYLTFVTAPPKQAVSEDSFLYPFQASVWGSIILTYVLVVLIVSTFLIITRWEKVHDTLGDSLFVAFWVPYAAALEQQNTKVPNNLRGLVCIWWIATIITGTGYK